MEQAKYYIVDIVAQAIIEQGGKDQLSKDNNGWFIPQAWTQGIAELNLYNSANNAIYLCWYPNNDDPAPVGIKVYHDQYKKS